MSFSMKVIKRTGSKEPISFDKILGRIRKASKGLQVNPDSITQQVLARIYDGVKTSEIDELTGQLSASLSTTHPDYAILAGRIIISNHQKNTDPSFTNVMLSLNNQINPKTKEKVSYISNELIEVLSVSEKAKEIDAKIDHDRDYLFDYFGFKTLEKSYLLKDTSGKILERPQHLWMRVSLAMWSSDLKRAFETYDYMSQKYFTHATPTLFNAGTKHQQLSSCFLIAMNDDSVTGIYKTLGDCAMISKHAGGIGLHLHNIRAKGSLIKGTNGTSNGIVPMLRVFNNTARYIDQCFTPETLIYTQNGVKRIEDVNTTDKVLTSNGTYENVNMPVRHEYKGKMLKIQVKNAISSIQVTPEHQIFALKGQNKGLNFDIIRNRLNKNIVKPEFEDSKDLIIGDFLVYSIPKYVNDIESMSEEDCRLYGIILGDGHISERTAYISLHSENKQDTANFVEEYFEKRGVKTIKEEREDLNTRIRWSPNSVGFKFTRSQLYDVNKEKHIDIPMLHLPNNKLIQIIRGIIETDGCVGTKEVSVEMSSDNVIEGLRYMLLRLGCLASGYDRDRIGNVSSYKNITTRKTTKVLRVPRINDIMKYFPDSPVSEYVSYLNHDGYIYSRIESIEEVEYDGVVHDFEIDNPHDYTVAHLGIVHNGGGRRNGSFAMYLEPWHADVEDFLRMKQNTGAEEERARDLFYALWIPDLFMKRIEIGGLWSLFCPNEAPGLADVVGEEFEALYEKYEKEGRARKQVSAQKLWFEILDAQTESGTPYLLYKDAANKKSNQQNLGIIKSSNLCVAPETSILTDKGHIQIKDAVNTKVNIWNGTQFSEVEVKQTGKNQKLITVNLSNGIQLICTPYHKFIISENYNDYKSLDKAKRVDASNLKPGMKLAKWDAPIIQGDSKYDFKYAYTHGFFCGDGTYNNGPYTKDSPTLSLYGEKKYLIDKLDIRSTSGEEDSLGRINTTLHKDIEKKFNVPIQATIKNKLEWFAGLLDADGTVARNGTNESLQIGSINKSFLDKILLMLQTLGVNAKVTLMRETSERLLPDGNGGNKLYKCEPLWRLLISSSGLYQLSRLGLKTHRLQFNTREPQRNAEQFVTVVSIEDNNRYDDTYCFNEPINHAGVFNGILTGNCTEVIQYSSPEETAVCNLASIGLPTFIKKDKFDFNLLRKVVGIVTHNLNRVIDINYYPTKETHTSNMRHRPIGMGVQGLADVFAMLKISWESPEATELNRKIFEHMYYAALEASMEDSKKDGPYSSFQGSPASKGILQFDMWNVKPSTDLEWDKLKKNIIKHGLRNSLLIAPMPTASTSQILGFNECFEPFTTNIYTRRTLAGEFVIINKYLLKELIDLGIWNEDLKQKIVAHNGSIQNISDISESIKPRYKTAWELSQKVLIDMAADRGAFICQSQSLNLFMADPNYAKLTSMHFYGWKKGLKTGCYYLRTKAPVSAQKFTIDPRMLVETDEERKKRERKELLDRLASEYEEEQLKAKQAAESGEGCLFCSS